MGGEKRYATPAQARRYASALDRNDPLGPFGRRPTLGTLPLWLARRARDRSRAGTR